MGPIRWVADAAREAHWDWSVETWVVQGMIVGFVLITCWMGLLMTRIVLRTTSLHVRWGLPLLLLFATVGSLFYWLSPGRFQNSNWELISRPGAQFTIGPFPSGTAFEELRRKGYTGIVSLLHPAVVPFEPVLLHEERASAEAAGIEFIYAPMLPWVSENTDSLKRIADLVQNGDGRYYVHCYLGKDRVNVVKRHLEVLDASYRILEGSPDTGQRLDTITQMQRGKVTELSPGVFLGACPTDGEWVSLVLSENIQSVVSLLDPAEPEDKSLLEKERQLLEDHGLTFVSIPLAYRPFDPEAVRQVLEVLAEVERPVLIHGFKSPSFRTEAVQQVVFTGEPGLPPVFFQEPLADGPAQVIGPRLAAGPRPKHFGDFSLLHSMGVRNLLFLGDLPPVEHERDQTLAEYVGMKRAALSNPRPSEVIHQVHGEGIWYVYGPELDLLRPRLKRTFGPPLAQRSTLARDLTVDGSGGAGSATSWMDPGRWMDLFPSLRMILLLGPFALLWTGMSAGLAGWLCQKKHWATPYTRKIFHFLIFSMAAVLHVVAGLPAVILYGSLCALAVLYSLIRGPGFFFYEAIARPTDQPHRSLFVLIPLVTTAVGGLLSSLVFGPLAAVGYLVGGWGDAMGEPVGTRWGRHSFRVPSLFGVRATRSIEGCAAVFVFSCLAAFASLRLLGGTGLPVAGVAVGCALVATVVEAFSTHGLDNLTIQFCASGAAWVLLML